MRTQLEHAVTALRASHFHVQIAENGGVACASILAMLPPDAVIGIGDSATVRQIGILDEIARRGMRILNPFTREITTDPRQRQMRDRMSRAIFTSDVLITGTNAVTAEGTLVNIDAVGNRVAAMIFGPKKVIVVVGRNKLVADVDDALYRIKHVIAPYHAKTKDMRTPCVQTGTCSECASTRRLCNVTTLIEKRPWRTDITVILVDEDLGLSWDEHWQPERINTIRANYEEVTWVFTSSLPPT
jgi:predicted NBD/HSP70 family sugar kinase